MGCWGLCGRRQRQLRIQPQGAAAAGVAAGLPFSRCMYTCLPPHRCCLRPVSGPHGRGPVARLGKALACAFLAISPAHIFLQSHAKNQPNSHRSSICTSSHRQVGALCCCYCCCLVLLLLMVVVVALLLLWLGWGVLMQRHCCCCCRSCCCCCCGICVGLRDMLRVRVYDIHSFSHTFLYCLIIYIHIYRKMVFRCTLVRLIHRFCLFLGLQTEGRCWHGATALTGS